MSDSTFLIIAIFGGLLCLALFYLVTGSLSSTNFVGKVFNETEDDSKSESKKDSPQ